MIVTELDKCTGVLEDQVGDTTVSSLPKGMSTKVFCRNSPLRWILKTDQNLVRERDWKEIQEDRAALFDRLGGKRGTESRETKSHSIWSNTEGESETMTSGSKGAQDKHHEEPGHHF